MNGPHKIIGEYSDLSVSGRCCPFLLRNFSEVSGPLVISICHAVVIVAMDEVSDEQLQMAWTCPADCPGTFEH